MTAREPDEPGRTSTPLELLFDLTFVVAVALLAGEFADAIAQNRVAEALPSYLMVFFAIWWAWMNFTWFASAYDNDDVVYRLLTMGQMAGVLVLAAGVPAAFEHRDFSVITYGYVIMRLAMLPQWLRAARADPVRRATSLRRAFGVGVLQIGWLLRLELPAPWGLAGFAALVVGELLAPYWAERRGATTWHPHHIAERYGLFTIIVLGECVLAATGATHATFAHKGAHLDLLLIGLGALTVLFGLWWLYFLQPAARLLEHRRELSFLWGYGHYGVFAALAALGAGLEVSAKALEHRITAPPEVVAGAVAVPIMIVLILTWALHLPMVEHRTSRPLAVFLGVTATGGVAILVNLGLPLPTAVLTMSLPTATLLVVAVRHRRRPQASVAAGPDADEHDRN